MYKVPEKFRLPLPENHPYHSKKDSMEGLFLVPLPYGMKGICLYIIATDGGEETDWEHVSISIKKFNPKKGTMHDIDRTPTWKEMCLVKSLFWDNTDCVVQFHPPEEEYVSQHHYTLHLWRNKKEGFKTPPSELVGISKGQKLD